MAEMNEHLMPLMLDAFMLISEIRANMNYFLKEYDFSFVQATVHLERAEEEAGEAEAAQEFEAAQEAA